MPDIIDEIKSMVDTNECIADSSSPEAIEQIRRSGVKIRGFRKRGANSVQTGVATVKDLLASNRLIVGRNCINTIREFNTYSYIFDKNTRKYTSKPEEKKRNHAMDALRYVLTDQEIRLSSGNKRHFDMRAAQERKLRQRDLTDLHREWR